MATKKTFDFARFVGFNATVTHDLAKTKKRHANRVNLSFSHADASQPVTKAELTHRQARALALFILRRT